MRAEDLFETVTADLVAAIEAGASSWQMPWRRLGAVGTPRSIDGRPYWGINALILGFTAAEHGWAPIYATCRGWQRHGAQVRRGERGAHVILWNRVDRPSDDDAGERVEDEATGRRSALLAPTIMVFAASQVDGVTLPAALPVEPIDRTATDAYFAAIGARVVVGGDRACYVPASDPIHLPEPAQVEHPVRTGLPLPPLARSINPPRHAGAATVS